MVVRRCVLAIGFLFILSGILGMKMWGYSDMMFAYVFLGALTIPCVMLYSYFEWGC